MLQRWAPLACALVGALLAPGLARGTEAAGCTRACPPPVLAEPEPALFQSVHLVWSDPHREIALQYEVARRARGAPDWTLIARPPAAKALHLDDVGARGGGLDPGAYEYRLRGLHRLGSEEVWSEWSEPRAARVDAACAESGGELSAALPRIVADDRDGDGRYTGKDLERALGECSTFGGCVLEALPVTYDDVAIVISDGDDAACVPGRTACITLSFSRGLVIEGHGPSTVLRSPLWTPPYQPLAILELWNRPDVRLQLRHLVLDGRKAEQRNPQPAGPEPDSWSHSAIQVSNHPEHDAARRSQGGCIHDVVVRDFLSRGVSLADVARWNLERNTIDGIGCDDPLTPCPSIQATLQPQDRFSAAGIGVLVGAYSDDVLLRENRILRATRAALALKHGDGGDETSIRRPQVLDNLIAETGAVGLLLGGVADGRFESNRIARTHDVDRRPESAVHNDTFGISCNGSVDRAYFLRNRIEDSAGMAIGWQCSGVGNTLAENRISGSCREKNPKLCVPGMPDQCYLQPDIWVGQGSTGSLVFADDEVVASGCAAPFGAELPKPQLELLIRGGRYEAGPLATLPVRFQAVDVIVERATRFQNTAVEFGMAVRGVVAPSVAVTGASPPYRADPSSQLLICPAKRSTCRDLCQGKDPPRWCANSDPPPPRRR